MRKPCIFIILKTNFLMGLNYKSLNQATRVKMIGEFTFDITNNKVYSSKRFTSAGEIFYKESMVGHLQSGTDDTLSDSLNNNNCFKTYEDRNTAKGITSVKVPVTASQTFSEGEFNRFYIRGLCIRALEEGSTICVYRARHSKNPRTESEALIGQFFDPTQLLTDLRNNIGIDTALGLPAGPNSGLSIELILKP
jgi:hypothetical protein